MDEKPDQIIGQIEAQRNQLGRNLNELEYRVKQSTDWRTYYERNPMLMLGAALGGGLLLGSMAGGKKSRKSGYSKKRYGSTGSYSASTPAAMGLSSAGVTPSSRSGSSMMSMSSLISPQHKEQLQDTLAHLKSALIGLGMTKAKEFLTQAIPGFDQHLNQSGQQFGKSHFADTGSNSGGGSQGDWSSDMYSSGGTGTGSEGTSAGSRPTSQWDTGTQSASHSGSQNATGSQSPTGSQNATEQYPVGSPS